MKKFKSFALPVAIVLLGVGAAVAGNKAKSLDASEPGYYFDSSQGQCVSAGVQCSTTSGPACTWTDANRITHNLSQSGPTMCGDPLYKLN